MKVAVFAKVISEESKPFIENLHHELIKMGAEIVVLKRLNQFIKDHCDIDFSFQDFDSHKELMALAPDFLITAGGDGTILDAVTYVRDSGIPLLGINTGRLGFLSNVSKENIAEAVTALQTGEYTLDERYLLSVEAEGLDEDLNFALNEVTVSRKDTTSMVTVHTYTNGNYLNSYWADGLIIATPTGSTGYSLSCGGPIIMPGSESFVITPIAPHNLNVRPFVIPHSLEIKLKVEGREPQFLVSLDSRISTLEDSTEVTIKLAKFNINLVKTEIQDFADTMRNKLMWGLDKRN